MATCLSVPKSTVKMRVLIYLSRHVSNSLWKTMPGCYTGRTVEGFNDFITLPLWRTLIHWDGCLGCFPPILFISRVSVKPRREQLSNKLRLSRWIFWVVGITRVHCPVSWNSCSAPCFSLSGPGLFGPETLLLWPLFALVTCTWLWPKLLSEGCLHPPCAAVCGANELNIWLMASYYFAVMLVLNTQETMGKGSVEKP